MIKINRKPDSVTSPQALEPEIPDQLTEDGEWADAEIDEAEQEIDSTTAMAMGLNEPTLVESDTDDDLTPETLLGDHRVGRWASREDEADVGLDPLPGEISESEE